MWIQLYAWNYVKQQHFIYLPHTLTVNVYLTVHVYFYLSCMLHVFICCWLQNGIATSVNIIWIKYQMMQISNVQESNKLSPITAIPFDKQAFGELSCYCIIRMWLKTFAVYIVNIFKWRSDYYRIGCFTDSLNTFPLKLNKNLLIWSQQTFSRHFPQGIFPEGMFVLNFNRRSWAFC